MKITEGLFSKYYLKDKNLYEFYYSHEKNREEEEYEDIVDFLKSNSFLREKQDPIFVLVKEKTIDVIFHRILEDDEPDFREFYKKQFKIIK